MARIIAVEGIGETYARKLNAVGIATTATFLERAATRKGRSTLANETGISETLILRWVNHVDLFRIKGVREQYAELLEAAGVDSVVELGRRVPEHLREKVAEINARKHLVRHLPGAGRIAGWIDQAKTMLPVVTH